MDFYAKAGQAVYLTPQSLLSEDWAIESLTTEIRWRCQFPWLSTSDSDGSSARLESETTADESEAVRIFNEFTGKVVEVSRTVTSDFTQQWCSRARMSRWRTVRMTFIKWLRRHNSCLLVL